MAHSSFEIKNCSDFYQILKDQLEEYRKDITSSRNAILTSILAYHLREWIWQEHSERIKSKLNLNSEDDFNKYFKQMGSCFLPFDSCSYLL